MSTRFLDDTACAILLRVSWSETKIENRAWLGRQDILCRECLVVHKEKVDVTRIVNEERLVARGHEVTGFLI